MPENRQDEGGEDGGRRKDTEDPNAPDSLAVEVSVNFSFPGAPLRAPVFLLALFSTENEMSETGISRWIWDPAVDMGHTRPIFTYGQNFYSPPPA